MNEIVSLIVPIACSIIIGVIGYFCHRAFADYDRRLEEHDDKFADLDDDFDKLRNEMTRIEVMLSAISERNALLLDHARRTNDKVDRILVELGK